MFVNKPVIVVAIVAGGVSTFPFEFKFYADSDITVFRTPVDEEANDVEDLLDPSDYTIISSASKIGGEIEVSILLTDGDTITIARSLPVIRTIDFATRGRFTAIQMNDDQDYQSYLLQDMFAYSKSFIKSSTAGSGGEPIAFPPALAEAYIRWSLDGKTLENDTVPPTWRDETLQFRNEAEVFKDEAEASATNAELEAWVSEAEAMTSDSYATEAEDVFVKEYTSNGDGTFTANNTLFYSSFHWNAKAQATNAPIRFIGLWDASTGNEPPVVVGTIAGDFYIVNVKGTINTVVYDVRDWIMWDGTVWSKVDQTPSGGVEAGFVMHFADSAIPTGWLRCDGSEVAQSVFPELFNAIGTTWDTFGGVIAPSAGNFRIPPQEFNGKPLYLMGSGANAVGDWVPENVGEHTHALSADSTFTGDVMTEHRHANTATFTGTALPNHSHTQPYNPIGGGGNIHHILGGSSGGYATSSVSAGTPSGSVSVTNLPNDIPLTPTGTVATTINETPITGNNNPESVVMVMCIKAFGVVYNPDSVDIQALEQQVLANETTNATQDTAIALNTAKVTYKDTMTFDGTTLTITIG